MTMTLAEQMKQSVRDVIEFHRNTPAGHLCSLCPDAVIRARHCEQAAAGYFYCESTPDDPCGPGQYPHDGHHGRCATS